MDPVQQPAAIDRRGLDKEALKRSFVEWLVYSVGKDPETAKDRDWYDAVALAVRDRLVDNWMNTPAATTSGTRSGSITSRWNF